MNKFHKLLSSGLASLLCLQPFSERDVVHATEPDNFSRSNEFSAKNPAVDFNASILVIGEPKVGKSTLMNYIRINEKRKYQLPTDAAPGSGFEHGKVYLNCNRTENNELALIEMDTDDLAFNNPRNRFIVNNAHYIFYVTDDGDIGKFNKFYNYFNRIWYQDDKFDVEEYNSIRKGESLLERFKTNQGCLYKVGLGDDLSRYVYFVYNNKNNEDISSNTDKAEKLKKCLMLPDTRGFSSFNLSDFDYSDWLDHPIGGNKLFEYFVLRRSCMFKFIDDKSLSEKKIDIGNIKYKNPDSSEEVDRDPIDLRKMDSNKMPYILPSDSKVPIRNCNGEKSNIIENNSTNDKDIKGEDTNKNQVLKINTKNEIFKKDENTNYLKCVIGTLGLGVIGTLLLGMNHFKNNKKLEATHHKEEKEVAKTEDIKS